MKALARLAGSVPGHDQPVELQNLLLEAEQLSTERGKARAGNLRHTFVARVGNNMQQFRNPFAPDWARQCETRRGARGSKLITAVCWRHEQMAVAVKHQAALLLRRLGWHEPHVGSGDGFTNCLCVSCIVFCRLT